MSYWIRIFNQKPIMKIDAEGIKAALTASNFNTLCEQYRIDPGLIAPALTNLEIIQAQKTQPLLFLLSYHQESEPPIRVYQWDVSNQAGAERLKAALDGVDDGHIRSKLSNVTHVIGVELLESQLRNIGLLLGYELARWAGQLGEGLIYSLNGKWYRLNRHQAFIPLSSD